MPTTYADMAFARNDSGFQARVRACAFEQALHFKDDGRPEFSKLANDIIAGGSSTDRLVPIVAAQPNMNADSSDPEILSAVQASWAVLGVTMVTP